MNQGIKALNLTSGVCHSTSTGVLSAKHNITNEIFHHDRVKVIYRGIMHSRVSFNSYNINAQENNSLRIVIK
jgi:hypothetical protein